ncbi:hypothetical protein O3G_MSEX015131 [Manduca sexta]|uniref:Uncharacterized protein n=1 Tax=Manduca sexta TaxID=7130 RepID=A0A922D4F1_MANSE|nr:hypothetical protein O3G_MSEX015131 [Manduca sexta]
METERMIEDTMPPQQVTSLTSLDTGVRPTPSSAAYTAERDACLNYFSRWNETDQVMDVFYFKIFLYGQSDSIA